MKSWLDRLDDTVHCPVASHSGRPTALAHHGCEDIHRVTSTSVYGAHGIDEEAYC